MAVERSEDYGALQKVVDALYAHARTVSRLDVVLGAEAADLPRDLMEVVELLPPGTYTRERLCTRPALACAAPRAFVMSRPALASRRARASLAARGRAQAQTCARPLKSLFHMRKYPLILN